MDSVRTTSPWQLTGVASDSVPRHGRDLTGVPVLDVIYLAVTLALFALVGLIARGVEKL